MPTRPNFIFDRLNNAALTFSPQTGIGTTDAPFSGSMPILHAPGHQPAGRGRRSGRRTSTQGQEVVFNALQQRFNDGAAVNIDEEMANLLSLQNAYAANARVLSTVKEMIDALMRI